MALPEPVRRGQVHPKDYQNEEYYGKLGPLVSALHEEVPDAKYDAKNLVIMLVQILHFQEAALGKDAMPPRVCPKLPIRLITDPAVGSGLHVIALKVHDIKRSRGLKAIEWQNPGKRRECLEVLVTLRRELERKRLLQVPLVHVSSALGAMEVQRLREYVRRLQANLAESPDESGVTHIIYPFGPGGDPDDGKEYTTVIAVKGNQARVHYWYQPDSYDEWIPLDHIEDKTVVPDKAPPGGRWKVTPKWIIDSEKYNEWMNPADYITPDFEAEMDAVDEAGDKAGKRGAGAQGGTAKKAKTDASRPEVAAEPVAVLDRHVVVRQVLNPHKGLNDPRGITVENLSQGQLNTHLAAYHPAAPPFSQPPRAPAAAAGDGAAGDGTARAAAKHERKVVPIVGGAIKSAQPAAYVAPASASWFKFNCIHDIERSFVPDFFNQQHPSMTPRLYRDYRDEMIRLYLAAPDQPLTFDKVRQHLDGEVNGLLRIYKLLEHWGLINYKPGGLMRPELRLPMPDAGGKVSAGMPPGTACLFGFKPPRLLEATAAAQQGGTFNSQHSSAAAARGDHRGVAPGSLLNPPFGRKNNDAGLHPSVLSRIYCSAMPWVDCTQLRYHCIRYPDINLCSKAYAEGRFPPGTSSRDFVRIEATRRHNSTDGWTPEETLLLLEGIELYREDWAAISAHVGTRSQAACLTHFCRLPIEDLFIEDIAGWGQGPDGSTPPAAAAGRGNTAAGAAVPATASGQTPNGIPQSSLTADVVPAIPFQDEQNPLMSTLGFLAVVLGPKVASAATQRALQVLAEGETAAANDLNVAKRIEAGPSAKSQEEDHDSEADSVDGLGTGHAGHSSHAAVQQGATAEQADGIKPEGADSLADGQQQHQSSHPGAAAPADAANGAADAMDVDALQSSKVATAGSEAAAAGQAIGAAAAAAPEPPQPDPHQPMPRNLVLAATAAGLAAAAVRSKLLADQEEREIQRLMVGLVDGQQKRVEAKMKMLNELNQVVDRECLQVESQLKSLHQEYLQLHEQRRRAEQAKAVHQQQQQAIAKHKAQQAAAAQQQLAAAQHKQQQQQAAAVAAAQKQQQQQAVAVVAGATAQQQLQQQQQGTGQPSATQQPHAQHQQAGQAAMGIVHHQQQQLQQGLPDQQQIGDIDEDDFDMP